MKAVPFDEDLRVASQDNKDTELFLLDRECLIKDEVNLHKILYIYKLLCPKFKAEIDFHLR